MALNGITGINTVSTGLMQASNALDDKNSDVSFADILKDSLDKVNQMQIDSQNLTDDFAAGKTDNIHEVMIAAEKADIALQFTMQIRNKILDAYNEIMRMQI